uniref:H15 domain-containing protein n=1 Tax=Panagrolaimus sp. JU765 TaxID=591449 RepID=A0AC34QFR7_9BILA
MPRTMEAKSANIKTKIAKKGASASMKAGTGSPKVSKPKKVAAQVSPPKEEHAKHPPIDEMIIHCLMDLKKKVSGVRLRNRMFEVYSLSDKSRHHVKKALTQMTEKGFLINDKEATGFAGVYHLNHDAVKHDEKMKHVVEKIKHKAEPEQASTATVVQPDVKVSPKAAVSRKPKGKKTITKAKVKKAK